MHRHKVGVLTTPGLAAQIEIDDDLIRAFATVGITDQIAGRLQVVAGTAIHPAGIIGIVFAGQQVIVARPAIKDIIAEGA